MHNRFALLLALGLIASSSALAQVTITDTHEGGKPVPKPAPFNMKSATQVQNVSRQAPLRNQDIIQMVKTGQQPSAILTTLQSRRGSFDLSPRGCAALRTANVSQAILNAMGGSGGSQCTSMPSPGSVQSEHNGGMLLGNRNATLLGNHGAAVTTPSNGGDPASLNPQPLPPRTSKGSLQNPAPANATRSAAHTNSATGTPGTQRPSSAPPQ
jgi:hypothetical protein